MDIPVFIKNLGHEIVAYILNISEENAQKVLENNFTLNQNQQQVLDHYISHLKTIRDQYLDLDTNKWSITSALSGAITTDNEHLLNYYRKVCGGFIPSIQTEDVIEKLVFKLAIEVYPLFLLKLDDNFNRDIGLSSFHTYHFSNLKENDILHKEILLDSSLKLLFSNGTNPMDTYINCHASSGIGGAIQLIMFPQLIISKIYELMTFKREHSINNVEKYTKIIISMYRELAEKKTIEVPYFIGFENIGVAKGIVTNDAFGTIYGYNRDTIKKLPKNLRPILVDEENYLGFILETTFQYEVDFDVKTDNGYQFPNRFKDMHKKIDLIRDNIALSFIFSNEKKLTSISHRWYCIFDLLSNGTSAIWFDRHHHTTSNPIIYSKKELSKVSHWYDMISKANDEKIQIAKHRLLSGMSKRTTNLDSFIDGIIALENIFGHGSGEIGFKLSMGVAFLLEEDSEKIQKLQKEVNKLYGDRSEVLHGAKVLTVENEKKNKERTLKILIDCLKKIYQQSGLIEDKNRGKTIIFNKTKNRTFDLMDIDINKK